MKKILFSFGLLFVCCFAPSQSFGATLSQNFSQDPLTNGWVTFGNINLFAWDSTNQNLRVTWDSSQPNSYFYHPLETTLTRTNDFMLAFDLRLNDIAIGVDTNKPFTFQIAIGLHNTTDATNAGFIVGSGYQAPNLVEFNYFPDSGFGASVTTPMISASNNFASGGFTFPLELATGTLYQFTMTYSADKQTLRSALSSNGVPVGPLQDAKLNSSFDDFRLDAVSISSYNDAGQFPGYEGSVLAHGVVDNLLFASPLPVARVSGGLTSNTWQGQFLSDASWLYTLERSTTFQSWSAAAPTVPGNGTNLILQDTNPPIGKAFYRVKAERP